MSAMIENVVPVSQNNQSTPKIENTMLVRIAEREQQRLEHRRHHDVDHHQRDQGVEGHLRAGLVLVLEAAAEAPAVARRAVETDFSAASIRSRASSWVVPSARLMRIGERGLAVLAVDRRGAVYHACTSTSDSSGTSSPSGAAQLVVAQVLDAGGVGVLEAQPDRDLVLAGPELLERGAAQRDRDEGGDVLGREAVLAARSRSTRTAISRVFGAVVHAHVAQAIDPAQDRHHGLGECAAARSRSRRPATPAGPRRRRVAARRS